MLLLLLRIKFLCFCLLKGQAGNDLTEMVELKQIFPVVIYTVTSHNFFTKLACFKKI